MNVLVSIFCLGIFSVIVQVLFIREMMVAFFGNELCIGTILAGWLAGIGAGALVARVVVARVTDSRTIRWLLVSILLLMALLLPVQVYVIRVLRLVLRVPAGEYAPFWSMAWSSLLISLPTCSGIGLFFPLACHALGRDAADAASPVSRTYAIESAGSLIGGIVMTFVLLPLLTPWQIILTGMGTGLAGAGIAAPRRSPRAALVGIAAAGVVLGLINPGWLQTVQSRMDTARWRAFGVLVSPGAGASPAVRLVRSEDSIYQNLAVTESEGQFALYGNGEVMFIFPDPISDEPDMHFIMAQKPDARRVLLLGGNPIGDIPELLKYPVGRLVYVDLDPAVGRMVGAVMPKELDAVTLDARVTFFAQDAIRFVRDCREKFDVIIIKAPEPTTAAANRFYTVEFFQDVRRLLSDGGFAHTAVQSSERLQAEALNMGATVYRTLKHVFPQVLVTAEIRNRFFAGMKAGLTFDRNVLAERSRNARLKTQFFCPEYFLGADEIEEEKVRRVEESFTAARVPLNTNMRPVAYFYNLVLWSQYSGSEMGDFLKMLMNLSPGRLTWILMGAGVLCLLGGHMAGRVRGDSPRAGRAWTRAMSALLIMTTGFCGMGLEIVLIFVFQSLYGYVYTRMGLIVAMFMVGLVLGSSTGKLMANGKSWILLVWLAAIECVLLVFSLGVPYLTSVATTAGSRSGGSLEWGIYLCVALVGWAVGAEFPLANRLFCDAGGRVGAAAAVTDATDHLGAALGSLLTGVILVPVFGITASCGLMAGLKAMGLLLLASVCVNLSAGFSSRRA